MRPLAGEKLQLRCRTTARNGPPAVRPAKLRISKRSHRASRATASSSRWRVPDALALGSFAVAHLRLANSDRADAGHDLTFRKRWPWCTTGCGPISVLKTQQPIRSVAAPLWHLPQRGQHHPPDRCRPARTERRVAAPVPLYADRRHGRTSTAIDRRRSCETSTYGGLTNGHLFANPFFHHLDGRDHLGFPRALPGERPWRPGRRARCRPLATKFGQMRLRWCGLIDTGRAGPDPGLVVYRVLAAKAHLG